MKRSLFPLFIFVGSLFVLSCQDNSTPDPTPPTQPPTDSPFDWVRQENSFTATLHDVFFVSSSQGWAVGEQGALLSTTSSGESWLLAPSALSDEVLYSVALFDEQRGWIAGQLANEETGGQVFLSQQGGAYPEEQVRTDQPLYTLSMQGKQQGWAAGGQGLLLHTNDGGSTWNSSTVANEETIFSVHFIDTELGWLATEQGSIYRTTDGSTWQPETTPDTIAIRAIQGLDDATAWACGDRNRILHRVMSEDGTPTWEVIRMDTEPNSLIWHDIYFLDDLQGWVVGDGGSIYHTTDGGASWERQLTNVSSAPSLYGIHMLSAQRGWVVGADGIIMTYTP
ncbi:MAG: YCF48-related protein [Cyclobacteriaceae bacterium]